MAITPTTSDISATSPTGVVVSPISVQKHATLEQWAYKFGKLAEVGDWTVKVAAAGFDKPVGTVLGTIAVQQGTQVLFTVPWNEASNPQINLNTEAIAALKVQIEAAQQADTTAIAAVDAKTATLRTAVQALPTFAELDPVKASVTTLQTDLGALDKSKASADSVATLDTAIAELGKSVNILKALPTSATKAELDSAIADYEAKLKTANDAVNAANKSISDNATAAATRLTAIEAKNTTQDTAIEAANKAITDNAAATATRLTAIETKNTAQDSTVAALDSSLKAIDTAYKAADTALLTKITALENPSTNNASYLIIGSPFTAVEEVGLCGLVHIRADGKIENASDNVQGKEANGIIDGPCAANASTNVYGTGARFNAIGLTGASTGSRLFLGTSGSASLSATGTKRQIQQVGIFRNGIYYFSFDDPGYWIAG